MTFSVRQALIDSGHFTEAPNRTLVHEQAAEHVLADLIAQTVLRFDMWGDLVSVESRVLDGSLRKVVTQNRKALGLPPQDDT